jgi:hypothetical protein
MSENYHYLPLVKQFLPPLAEVFELTEPDNRIAIFTADLDGDQIFEIAAAYRLNGEHYVMILKNKHNTAPGSEYERKQCFFRRILFCCGV